MPSESQTKGFVASQLASNAMIDARNLSVSVHNEIVTLHGHVPTYLQKLAAAHAAARVRGVRAVVDEVAVLPAGGPLTDEAIASVLWSRLRWDADVPDAIRASVRRGVVTLEGEVRWRSQKDAAIRVVSGVPCVTCIEDHVSVQPEPKARDIIARITDALSRHGHRAADLRVSTQGDTVTLEGSIGRAGDLRLITRATWSVPGVRHIENNLSVCASDGAKS